MIDLLLCLLLQTAQPIAEETKPNVLIIILDDVGQQDVDAVHTPSIDALAANGLKFNRGYAQPVCAPSRYALMFGKHGQSAGSVCFGPDSNTPDISWMSLSRFFKNESYNTAFLGKWHLGSNNVGQPWELTPNLHGYDQVFAGVPGNLSANACGEGFEGTYTNWLCFENGSSFISNQYQTIAARNKFGIWWSRTQGPKFAVLSFQGAHSPFHEPPSNLVPYQPPGGPGYTARRILYEKMIISLDVVIGQLASVVSLNDTYIVLIGDNGTPPDARSPSQTPGRLKTTPYEGGVRVPFIIAGPGIGKNITSNSIVNVVDILPTLAELVGKTVSVVDGVSFYPTLLDPAVQTRDHVFVHNDTSRAVIENRFKLININGSEDFYDLLNDPNENNALPASALDPAIVQRLRDRMNAYTARGL